MRRGSVSKSIMKGLNVGNGEASRRHTNYSTNNNDDNNEIVTPRAAGRHANEMVPEITTNDVAVSFAITSLSLYCWRGDVHLRFMESSNVSISRRNYHPIVYFVHISDSKIHTAPAVVYSILHPWLCTREALDLLGRGVTSTGKALLPKIVWGDNCRLQHRNMHTHIICVTSVCSVRTG